MEKSTFGKERTLSVLLIYLAVDAVLGAALFGLWFGATRAVSDIAAFKKEAATISSSVSQLAGLKRDSVVADALLPRISQMLPNEDQLLFISNELTGLAVEKGLEAAFNFGNPLPSSSASAPGAIAFTMSLEGTFRNFVDYLIALAKLPYVVQLSNFDIQQVANRYRFTLSGVIFTQ